MTEENLTLKDKINKMHLFCSDEDDELVPDRVEDNFDVIKEILLSLVERVEQLEENREHKSPEPKKIPNITRPFNIGL